MTGLLPDDIAVVVVGLAGAALAHRLRRALPGASLHGPIAYPGDWDEHYDRASAHIGRLFEGGQAILGICASGILIRSVAPFLASKREEPAVVAVAEDGSVVVPLIGGHRGANALARSVAELTGGVAAVTTAGDLRLGVALDEPPPGWRIADADKVKPVAAALLRGEPVSLQDETGCAGWLRAGSVRWAENCARRIVVTDRQPPLAGALVFHPPILAIGIGCSRDCPAREVADLARSAFAEAGLAADAVALVVSVEQKLAEPAIHALAAELRVPARFFPASRLLAETPRLTERSLAAYEATGCWGVAEGAALAAAGSDGALVVTKRKSGRATCAVARAPQPIDAVATGRPRGRLSVVGIGPGDPGWRTPEASAALAEASDVVGYGLYLDLLGRAIVGKRRHASPIGEEAERVRLALDLAAEGRSVALVSSGDAGIYGLAPLVYELLDTEARPEWHAVEVRVFPGISALQAAACRAGAPLGHDFCAVSLSDLMTQWETIRMRLEAAAAGDFVVALYNPRSARRRERLSEAAEILLRHRPPETPVFLGRNLGRDEEEARTIRLSELSRADVDMLTVVLIGNSQTRLTEGNPPRIYTPRGYFHRAS